MVKNLPANAADARDVGSIHGVGKSPWSRKWQPTPVFLPEGSMNRRAWQARDHGVAESDTTEHACNTRQG